MLSASCERSEHLLDLNSLSITLPRVFEGGSLILRPTRCKLRVCPDCGPKFGSYIRGRLHGKVASGKLAFSQPRLFTLTVDRRHFASPEAAYRHIADGSYMARLLRLLGVLQWVAVLEFQSETGDGWPHWHILFDLAAVGFKLNLAKAWHLWRDTWGLGGLDLSERKSDFQSMGHAINYQTKYLTKSPVGGWPQWVMESKRRIRFISASKSVGPIVSKDRTSPGEVVGDEVYEEEEEALQADDDKVRGADRGVCLGRRASICGLTTTFFLRGVKLDVETGEVKPALKWMGVLQVPLILLRSQIPVTEVDGDDVFTGERGELERLVEPVASACWPRRERMRVLRGELLCDSVYNSRKPLGASYTPFLSDEELEIIDSIPSWTTQTCLWQKRVPA